MRASPLMEATVKKLGVRLSPPSLLLVYRPAAAASDRLRKMPVKSLTAASSCARVAQELRDRHQPHLDAVPQRKLLKMLRILQEGLSGGPVGEILPRVEAEFRLDPNEDLNKLPTDQLERKKAAMDEHFLRHVVKPGHPDFVYDLRQEFDGPKQSSGWDEQEEEDDDDW
ncbi:centrosomal protein of 19 kDa-like [Pollicipes pollicipes]|uniref:centrosomal protein of 19 kDa-like n=1 Tax=Pollicipes pollicipes TaxID=41117 RepID=UPI00188503A0|nr:centrosomal protein of 19 kDa-like [Pollicipes pollicipes]